MLYLASASPRRHELLKLLNIAHQVLIIPNTDAEDEPIYPGERPTDYAQRTTREKLARAQKWIRENNYCRQTPILCADTCVALDDEVLGKPANQQEAESFLRRLSQRSHWVYTAQALAFQGKVYQSLSSNKVIFRALTEEEIKAYCATEEPYGKAGGYGIQGTASYFIQALQGRYSAVVGLDIYDLYQLFQQAGLQQLCFPPR